MDYRKTPEMSYSTFVTGFLTKLSRLQESMPLDDKLAGLFLLNQSDLSKEGRSRIRAFGGGKINLKEIVWA